jgi:hypothetical protein
MASTLEVWYLELYVWHLALYAWHLESYAWHMASYAWHLALYPRSAHFAMPALSCSKAHPKSTAQLCFHQ